ncbi:MAG: hypothetical protein LBD75_04050 [Candidatus Peribacteria bacterium]|jgi:hypothetical protein|nr:hypothetical protein [Candidatus Peribacteria bacterium]
MTQSKEKSNFIYRVGVVRLIVFAILVIIIAVGTYFFKPKFVEAPTFPPEQPSEVSSGEVNKSGCEALIVSGVDAENVQRCVSSIEPCSPEQMAYEQCVW